MAWSVQDVLMDVLRKFGYILYIMNPSEHMHEKVEDVKDFYKEVTPVVIMLSLGEYLLLLWQKKSNKHDFMCNLIHAFMAEVVKIPTRYTGLLLYTWVYTNFRIITLPWNSVYTWLIGVLVTDFMFYWLHRLTHQVSIFWATHETHHTLENLTISGTLRNSILYLTSSWVIIHPGAFCVPPSVYLVHYQLVFIFQLLLHTEQVGKLPAFVEYIFNTPSNHRVHHARNRKYIDKNFGAVFIFWDRIFGTYEEEDPNDKPVFGTTTRVKSYNPLVIQTTHFRKIWNKFWEYEGIRNKISVIIKGPGWTPGKPWTGNLEDIPHPPPKYEPNNPVFPLWLTTYILVHFTVYCVMYLQIIYNHENLSKISTASAMFYIVYTSVVFGFVLDKSRYAIPLEFIRFFVYFATEAILYQEAERHFLLFKHNTIINRVVFTLSIGVLLLIAIDGTLKGLTSGAIARQWFGEKSKLRKFRSSVIDSEKKYL